MSKLLPVFFAVLLLVSGCNKEAPPPLTKGQIRHIADSLAKERIKYIDEQAQIILEHRMKIEMKIKVDSAVYAINLKKAATTAQQGKDTLNAK